MKSTTAAAAALATVACLLVTTLALAGNGWEEVTDDEGVRVEEKEVAGRNMPIFRGRTTINARIYTILAVLADFDKHPQWQHACMEAALLKEIDPYNRISYNRIDSPWPVDDRDVVVRSVVKVIPEKNTVSISLKGIASPLKPEVEDVVRMPRMIGTFTLKALGPKKTWVQYQIDADPGGSLPDWVARSAVEDIPFNTLKNLRARTTSKGIEDTYADFIKAWDPQHNPKAPVVIPQ